MIPQPISEGLSAFREEFAAQLELAGPPNSEHAVHFCLALGFQRALGLAPGSVVFERPVNAGRVDLWVLPLDLAIEVKFHRVPPSGKSPPFTQKRGQLLADFNKLARKKAAHRLVLLAADPPHMSSLAHGSHKILPLNPGEVTLLSPKAIALLPKTAATHAVADGDWRSCEAELVWRAQCGTWHVLAWSVRPIEPKNSSDNSTASSDQVGPTTKEAIVAMPSTPSDPFEAVWQRIVGHAGQDFKTITSIPFSYEVQGNTIKPQHVNYNISKSQFEKAYSRCPLDGPGHIHELIGPSYIYAILSDQRIVSAG